MPPRFMVDAQQALGFLVQQLSYIEPTVYETQYPDIQYPSLIPVDTSAPDWVKSVTYFSTNKAGRAGWFHHRGKDLHMADIERSKAETTVEMADIGYDWSLEELGQAMMVPGLNLSGDRANAARRASEEFIDDLALRGDSDKNMVGLLNYPGLTIVNATADGNGGNPYWIDKVGDADKIIRDVNIAISGMWTSTKQVELADTILMPIDAVTLLATTRLPNTTMTILQFLMENNVYTFTTGRPLTIRTVRGLESAGVGGVGRMIVYKRDPQVLKMHIPMPHRFLPPWQTAPLVFTVPGIFRLGGLEIRRPSAVRYVDGISAPVYQ
jgi:hypothetical protein